MPRRVFPAGTVTNTTGAPLRLEFYPTSTSIRREADLWTVDGSNNLVERIANGVVLTDAVGAYSAFAGPDDMDILYALPNNTSSRTTLTATGTVTGGTTVDTATFAKRSNNLSDLTSASSARTSLGLGASAVMSTAQIAADSALTGTYGLRPVQVSDLSTPYVFAHRGGSNLFPENTLESFRGAVSLGCPIVETDVSLLSDGALGLMHDSTVDRTTTSSGTTTTWTAPAWRQLVSDAGSFLGGGWSNTVSVPTFGEMLSAVGGLAILCPEAKNGTILDVTTAMVRDVVRAGLQKSVIIQTSTMAAAAVCQAAGIACMITQVSGTEFTTSQLNTNGVTWYGVQTTSVTDPTITALKAAGIKVIGYLINRQVDIAAWLARGGDGYFTDDPIYAQGASTSYAYYQSSVPMLGTWSHGMLDNTALNDRWSWSTSPVGLQTSDGATAPGTKALLLGPISPVKSTPAADTFTLEFDWTWTVAFNSGRWVGCFISTADGQIDGNTTRTGVNGYRFLYSQAGALIIYPVTNNAVGSALVSTTFSSLTLPQTFTLQLTVSPTALTWKDKTNNHTVTVNDATYRGGYVSLAASGATAVCTRVAVTA